MTRRTVSIVPHTHWDREWYSPFQTFRLRLVDLLDDLLPRLDADPSYAHFMLDGQMAVVDDYLAVRPEAEATLRRLAASGRVSAGPWYILMDEFLVSGETTVRNLQRGLDRAAAFGGAMDVGYLPDMFGHVAQMPQLLALFGFEHAVVWRGVPSSVDRSAFWWSAPDGSTVRAEYLPQGYGNGARLPDDAKALVGAVADFESDWESFLVGPILWMNGTDHLMPQPWLGRVVDEANGLQDDYELVVTSLADHLSRAATDDLPAWTGELRSGARANLLMGVTSNRVDVRQAAARAERSLEQLAEPLAALHQPPERWPGALLDEAWLSLIRNSAHDSICACSVDEVCDAVLHRYAEATQIGEGLAARALNALASTIVADGPVIVNPSARPRSGLVELILPGNDPLDGAQVLNVRPAERVLAELDLADMAAVVIRELKHNDRILGLTLESVDTGAVLWSAERDEHGELLEPGARTELDALAGSATGRVRIRATALPTQKVLARVSDVPGFGWRTFAAGALDVAPVTASDAMLDNGLVRIDIAADGTWSINGVAGFGRIVHGGDVGDTYNWCPPDGDSEIDRPERVAIEVLESGPVRARVRIAATYRWPERHGGPLVDVDVATTLELGAGEPFVRVETAWTNRTRDQRVRVTLPLPEPATSSRAECVFAVVERGLEAEGGPTELGIPTFPSKRFVQAGGLTVVHDGVREYELTDIRDGHAHELALTLARCTGLLSQGPMATRPLPAGPITPMEGSQLQKPVVASYALHVGDADPFALADDVLVPLQVLRATSGGVDASTATSGQALSVDGAPVSSLRRAAGRLELRVFNPSADTTTVTVDGRRGWLVDLRGRPVEPFEEQFTLGPWRIATAVLDD
ncbi:MAG: 2-O-(6-phospho-alpha-D-mannosyl)-D-glycerate hydrolase [Acidimicrobiaceae bacterium]|jgi:alpha-mannosidase